MDEAKSGEKWEARLIDVAKALCWYVMLFGGVLLLLHFLQVGYLPRVDIPSLMGVIAGVAGLGILLLGLIIVFLLLPGAAANLFAELGIIPIVPVAEKGKVLSADDKAIKRHALLSQLFGAAIAALIIAIVVLRDYDWWFGAIVTSCGALVAVTCLIASAIPELMWFKRRWWPLMFHTGAYCFWWVWTALLYAIVASNASANFHDRDILLLAALSLLIHVVAYGTKGEHWKVRVAILGALVAYTFVASGLSQAALDQSVRALKLGMMDKVQLTMTATGCAVVQASGTHVSCKKVLGTPHPVYLTDPLDVATRVGADALLSPPGGLADRKSPRFTVPNSEILGIVISATNRSPANSLSAKP